MASIFERTNDPFRKLYEFKQQYRNVNITEISGHIFIYRSLGRLEYRQILEDSSINNYEKEDMICKVCLLHPNNFDFENCAAGIPTQLTKEILEYSFLDSLEMRDAIMMYYRAEMVNLENQITCLIHEAFPEYDIEDIEKWDVEKTTKFMASAEWILKNLRGLNITAFTFSDINKQQEQPKQQPKEKIKPALRNKEEKIEPVTEDLGKPIEKVRPVKQEVKQPQKQGASVDYAALEEMKRQFPQMDWSNLVTPEMAFSDNDVFIGMDTRPPALRDKSVKI